MDERVYQILIIDDEIDVVDSLYLTLIETKEFNCEITTALNGKAGLFELGKKEFDLVLSDYRMPGMNGVEFLQKVKEICPNTIRLLITGYSDITVAREAINKAHVYSYIEKPWNNEELRMNVYEALQRKVEREAKNIKEIDRVAEAIRVVNDFRSNVLSEQKLIFSFRSTPELNKFSFNIKKMNNVHIKDFHIFENRYIISVVILPEMFDFIP